MAHEVPHATSPVQVFHRPVGWVCSVVAGVVAGVLFKRVWSRIAHGDHQRAPSAVQSDYRLGEILVAATLHGAISGRLSRV